MGVHEPAEDTASCPGRLEHTRDPEEVEEVEAEIPKRLRRSRPSQSSMAKRKEWFIKRKRMEEGLDGVDWRKRLRTIVEEEIRLIRERGGEEAREAAAQRAKWKKADAKRKRQTYMATTIAPEGSHAWYLTWSAPWWPQDLWWARGEEEAAQYSSYWWDSWWPADPPTNREKMTQNWAQRNKQNNEEQSPPPPSPLSSSSVVVRRRRRRRANRRPRGTSARARA